VREIINKQKAVGQRLTEPGPSRGWVAGQLEQIMARMIFYCCNFGVRGVSVIIVPLKQTIKSMKTSMLVSSTSFLFVTVLAFFLALPGEAQNTPAANGAGAGWVNAQTGAAYPAARLVPLGMKPMDFTADANHFYVPPSPDIPGGGEFAGNWVRDPEKGWLNAKTGALYPVSRLVPLGMQPMDFVVDANHFYIAPAPDVAGGGEFAGNWVRVPGPMATTPGLAGLAAEPAASPDKLLNIPVPKFNYQPDFGGYLHPQTLPWGQAALELGFGYNHTERNRDDLERITDRWLIGDLNFKLGLPRDMEFQLSFPIQTITDTTLKDPTGHDYYLRNGNGDLSALLKMNLWGEYNDGFSAGALFLHGEIPTASYNGRLPDFGSTTKDSGRSNEHYALGAGFIGTVNLPGNSQAGISSEVLLGRPDCFDCCDCCCCACFDNRISLATYLGANNQLGAQLSFDTKVTNARKSDWEGVIQGGLIYSPTPNLQFYAGPTYSVTAPGSNIGASLAASYQFR
jgi:hypothetical protein